MEFLKQLIDNRVAKILNESKDANKDVCVRCKKEFDECKCKDGTLKPIGTNAKLPKNKKVKSKIWSPFDHPMRPDDASNGRFA